MICSLSICLISSMTLASATSAATLPYVEDFDDGTEILIENLPTTDPATTWQITGGPIDFSYSLSIPTEATPRSASATNTFEGLGDNALQDFEMETDFTVTGSVGTFLFSGFMVLGSEDNPNFDGYLVEFRFETGEMRIREIDGGANTLVNEDKSPLTVGQTYNASVVGEYGSEGVGGADSIKLTYTISGGDLVTPYQVIGTDTDGALQEGTHFGLRNRYQNTGITIEYDDFSLVAVPEPASVALLAVGASLVGVPRRSATRV